jgi:hypothetical protein
MTSFKTIAAAALVALTIPVAGVAKDGKVTGPVQLAGKGFFGGELTMATIEKQRPVRIAGRGGYVGILDRGGDLKVRCTGKARVQKKQTERGTVYLCAGRAGAAVVLGSHFLFRGFAVAYRVQIPAGVEGTFHGGAAQRGTGEEPTRAEPGQRGSAPTPAAPEDEEIPTLAQLAAMLAGK